MTPIFSEAAPELGSRLGLSSRLEGFESGPEAESRFGVRMVEGPEAGGYCGVTGFPIGGWGLCGLVSVLPPSAEDPMPVLPPAESGRSGSWEEAEAGPDGTWSMLDGCLEDPLGLPCCCCCCCC